MAIFNLFNSGTSLRCTHCLKQLFLSKKRLRFLEQNNEDHSICSIVIHCHFCRSGFLIPIDYTDPNGNHFTFDNLKTIIDNLPSAHPFLNEPGLFDDDFHMF